MRSQLCNLKGAIAITKKTRKRGIEKMSLATYGVLKCRALDHKIDPATDPSPHYQVLVSDGEKKHRYTTSASKPAAS
jgi:hypothetical protein